jgi:Ca-activated chloride channel homolog
MAVIFFQPVFWLTLFLLGFSLFWIARSTRLRWWPAFLLRALLAIVILAAIFFPKGKIILEQAPARELLIIDVSDSLSETALQSFKSEAVAWQKSKEGRIILVCGETTAPVLYPEKDWPKISGLATLPGPAFDKALGMIGNQPGRIIFASDGLIEETEIIPWIQHMKDKGHRLDVIPLPSREGVNGGRITGLQVPSVYWDNTSIDAVVSIDQASSGVNPEFWVVLNGEKITPPIEEIQENTYYIQLPEQQKGLTTISVYIESEDDEELNQSSAHAFIHIYESPNVLLVTQTPEADPVIGLQQELASNSIRVDVIQPEELSDSLAFLRRYQVIILHNFLSHHLTFEQMKAVDQFVRKQGGGLVFIGGKNSYSLGGYKNTLMEPLLPVKLEPPPRLKRLPAIFILVIDRSYSMIGRPIALALEGAMRAVETLNAEDLVGLLSFATDTRWDVPVQTMGDGLAMRRILDAISLIRVSGGTYMFRAMQEVIQILIDMPEEMEGQKIILVLTDGKSSDGNTERFLDLSQSAADNGIIISTIGLGKDADNELLAEIASVAKGRHNFVLQPDDLPRIMMAERNAANSDNIQTGITNIIRPEPHHPVLFGIDSVNLPTLRAYNAQSSLAGQGAEDILISANFGDPLLSARHAGLGRVIAWMGDLGEEWSSEWANAENKGQFWTQVVRYALTNPSRETFRTEVIQENNKTNVRAWITDDEGTPSNFTQVFFQYTGPSGEVYTLRMSQESPGGYVVELPDLSPGVYRGLTRFQEENGIWVEAPAPFVIQLPQENFHVSEVAGLQNLHRWAADTNGEVISLEMDIHFGETTSSTAPTFQDDLWWKLVLILLISWPIEIAIRRQWLPWR